LVAAAADEDHSRHDDHERRQDGRADHCPADVGVVPRCGFRLGLSVCHSLTTPFGLPESYDVLVMLAI
jgi:hypothetical protein